MNDVYQHLRFLPVKALNAYLQKRYNDLPAVYRFGLDHIKFMGDFILTHSWKPGYIKLSKQKADSFRTDIEYGINNSELLSLLPEEWKIEDKEPSVTDLDGIIDKVLVNGLFELLMQENNESITSPQSLRLRGILEGVAERVPLFPAIQNGNELKAFLKTIQIQKPSTVVEIGTASGGLFYCLCQLVDPEGLLISIDYPGGPYGGGQEKIENELFKGFKAPKQQLGFIRDRSFHLSTKRDLVRKLGNRKIDLLVIDGDHSYGGVSSDFYMYKDLVAKGGIIAFHDINMRPETWGRGYDVGVFWDEIKKDYEKVEEIVDSEGEKKPSAIGHGDTFLSYGIGILNM